MKIILSYALIFITSVFSIYAQSKDSLGNIYLEALPPPGVQPKLPDGYTPYKYPYTPEELMEKHSSTIMGEAENAWEEIEGVNSKGNFEPTYESLGNHKTPEWYKDAKIGMFVNWGPWSVGGYALPQDDGATYPDWYEKWIYDDSDLKKYHQKN